VPAAHAAIAWPAGAGHVDNGSLSSRGAGSHQGGAGMEGLLAGAHKEG